MKEIQMESTRGGHLDLDIFCQVKPPVQECVTSNRVVNQRGTKETPNTSGLGYCWSSQPIAEDSTDTISLNMEKSSSCVIEALPLQLASMVLEGALYTTRGEGNHQASPVICSSDLACKICWCNSSTDVVGISLIGLKAHSRS